MRSSIKAAGSANNVRHSPTCTNSTGSILSHAQAKWAYFKFKPFQRKAAEHTGEGLWATKCKFSNTDNNIVIL